MAKFSTVLGKYQLCRVLGTGRVGTVFLAVHLELEEYRAIKRVPKSFLDYERFRREALILKDLRHPGIPIVYDIEEDESYSYLIEEYLEGESLYDLVKRREYLSRELTIHYGLELTRIISYLHSAEPNPILHLDLQPKNLLLCHGTIKLIDFDHAAYTDDANMAAERYGTVGWAAPEQYETDETLDERTDLYAIGVVLHYLCTGAYPCRPYEPVSTMGTELTAIICTCLESNRENRFSSARELAERLAQLESVGTAAPEKYLISSLVVALAGNKSGAGTTHVAVGLSVYLKNLGYPNLYEEKNDSGMGLALGKATGAVRDRYGLMQYHDFVWKPAYGPGVRLMKAPYETRILDFGPYVEQALESGADGVVLVCDSRCWSRESVRQAIEKVINSHLPYAVVYNHTAQGEGVKPLKGVNRKACLRAPYYSAPWKEQDAARTFYRELLSCFIQDRSFHDAVKDRRKRAYYWLHGRVAFFIRDIWRKKKNSSGPLE